MENFQVKRSQCDSIIFLKAFSLENSRQLWLNLCLADSSILYFWQVLESIHKFIIVLHVLQCLFVKGSDKKQRRGRIIQIHKRRDFFISHDNQVLLGIISQFGPPSCTLQKRSFFPLQFGQEENISGNSIARGAY